MFTLAPKKKFGQNFLTDQSIIEKIVQAGGELENKNVLEIGGGTGNLTRYLLKKKPKKLIVVEIDKDYIETLNKILKNEDVETILVSQDILRTNFSSFFSEPPIVFGNLPYNISTKILTKLLKPLDGKRTWEKLFLMFQLEVANRVVAKPGTKQYGRLSLFSKFYSFPSIEFEIPKKSFFPIPKVESALVKFQYNDHYYNRFDSSLFEEIIRISFQSRRKMIKNILKIGYENIQSLMENCSIKENSRPEELTLQQFCCLTDLIGRIST
jgi:16S rRNA (adenine1518-N6/adenine1519-N6)-dimethyltransferase